MYRYYGIIRGFTGPGLAGQSVYVYRGAAGTSLASIYNSVGGGLSNPTTTDARGAIDVYSPLSQLWYKITGDTVVQPLPMYTFGPGITNMCDYGASPTASAAVNTAAMNAALLAGGRLMLPDGVYFINAPLIIHSDTHLELAPDASVTLQTGSNCYALANAAIIPQRTVTDAAINSASNILNSATANFTSGDVGRTVVVADAGPVATGTYNPLVAEIVTRNSSTQVVLSIAAQNTVTGKTCSIHVRDHNITVSGGTWYRESNEGVAGLALHTLVFRHVDILRVRDLSLTTVLGKYALNPGDVTDFVHENISLNTGSDGINVNGPAKFGRIGALSGVTGDDTVSIMAAHEDPLNDVSGNISEIVVEGITTDCPDASPCKVLGGTGYTVKQITIRDIAGSAAGGVWIGNDWGMSTPRMQSGTVDGIVVDGVSMRMAGSNTSLVFVNAAAAGHVTLRNLHADMAGRGGAGMVVHVSDVTNIASLLIDGVHVVSVGAGKSLLYLGGVSGDVILRNVTLGTGAIPSGHIVQTVNNATVGRLIIDGVAGEHPAAGYLVQLQHATDAIARLVISRVVTTGSGSGGLWKVPTSTMSCPNVCLSDCCVNAVDIIASVNVTQLVTIANCQILATSGVGFSVGANGAVTLDAQALSYYGDTNSITSGGSLTSRSLGFRAKANQVALTAGCLLYNTNGALACGVGAVVCNGTSWKHLYTDAVYTP